MSAETIERDFRKTVSEQIRLQSEGENRYRVFTPFQFDDRDHLVVVLRRDNGSWQLSDEGHTYMHLSYDLDERELHRGTRAKVIGNALDAFAVEDRDGELLKTVTDHAFGDALYDFVQALLKITDVSYLSRERVRSTFLEDFRAFLEAEVPPDRRHFDWSDPEYDAEGKYPVDCLINKSARPLAIFALLNDDRVRDATISLLQFERWNLDVRSVGIFEDQEQTSRKVLARFSDTCEKQFSSLSANTDRIRKYLRDHLTH